MTSIINDERRPQVVRRRVLPSTTLTDCPASPQCKQRVGDILLTSGNSYDQTAQQLRLCPTSALSVLSRPVSTNQKELARQHRVTPSVVVVVAATAVETTDRSISICPLLYRAGTSNILICGIARGRHR